MVKLDNGAQDNSFRLEEAIDDVTQRTNYLVVSVVRSVGYLAYPCNHAKKATKLAYLFKLAVVL